MRLTVFSRGVVSVVLCLALAAATARSLRGQSAAQKGAAVTLHAKGTFEVKLTPQPSDDKSDDAAAVGRRTMDKQFHGDIEGTSLGQMLGGDTAVKGSAG